MIQPITKKEYDVHYEYQREWVDDDRAGIPSVEEFTEFANFFFKQEAGLIKQKTSLRWQIGGILLDEDGHLVDGATTRQKDGSILIQISRQALIDSKLLYLTIGHELVHAADLTNGNYEKWQKEASLEIDAFGEKFIMGLITEYHAYSWDAALEGQLAEPNRYGAQKNLESYRRELEALSLLSIFEK